MNASQISDLDCERLTSNTGEGCRPHHGYLSCGYSSKDFGRNCGLHYPLGQFICLSIDRLSFPLQHGTRLSCQFSVVFEVGLPFLHKCSHSFSPVILEGKGRREVKSASSYWAPWMAPASPRSLMSSSLPACQAHRQGSDSAMGPPAAHERWYSPHTMLCLGTRRCIPHRTQSLRRHDKSTSKPVSIAPLDWAGPELGLFHRAVGQQQNFALHLPLP